MKETLQSLLNIIRRSEKTADDLFGSIATGSADVDPDDLPRLFQLHRLLYEVEVEVEADDSDSEENND